jgi:branched-chain amino acid transport system permease protein
MSSYVQDVFIVICAYGLVTLGLQVTLSTGQFSATHAGLMGVGGYAGGVAAVSWHASLLMSLLFGGAVAGVTGVLIAFLLLRTSGFLLGTVTIAIGQAMSLSANNIASLGGAQGYSGIPLDATLPWAAATLAVGLGVVLCVQRSRFGMSVLAAGKDDTVARSLGISMVAVRVWGFGAGAALAGLGGVIYGHYTGVIEPTNLAFSSEPLFFTFLLVGGVNTPWGAVLGTVGVWWLEELLRFGNSGHWLFFNQYERFWVLGLVLVATVLFRPNGLLPRLTMRHGQRVALISYVQRARAPSSVARLWSRR